MIPSISVVIPAFNAEKYLHQCLDSIVDQSFSDLEIICVDDGSTDDTGKIFEEYAKLDNRFVVIHQNNMGPGIARNTGLDVATGKYIIFIDSDDYIENKMLEHMFLASEEKQAQITICKAFELCDDKKSLMEWSVKVEYLPTKEVFSSLEVKDHIIQLSIGWAWDKLFLSHFLKENNIRFPDLNNSEDMMFVFPAMILASRICIVHEKMIYHRVNISSSVSSRRRDHPYCFILSCGLLKKFLIDHDLFSGDYKKSYINWCLEYSIWNMDTLPFIPKLKVYHKLKKQGLDFMNLNTSYGKDYFDNKVWFKRLKKIEKQSTFSFLSELLLYSIAERGVLNTIKYILSKDTSW